MPIRPVVVTGPPKGISAPMLHSVTILPLRIDILRVWLPNILPSGACELTAQKLAFWPATP